MLYIQFILIGNLSDTIDFATWKMNANKVVRVFWRKQYQHLLSQKVKCEKNIHTALLNAKKVT